MNKIFAFAQGSTRIKVEGPEPERFLNLCANKGMILWDASCRDEIYCFNIDSQYLVHLDEISKKTGCRFEVMTNKGFPALWRKLWRYPGYLAGALGTLLFVIGTSLFIWRIQIRGNRMFSDEALYQVLSEYKVHIGSLAKQIDPNALEKILRTTFDEFTWVSVSKNGMTLLIEVKEKDPPQSGQKQEQNAGSGNLISPYDGSICSIVTRTGVPKVMQGQDVEQGTVLVEGAVPTYDEDGNVKEFLYLHPDADIKLQHLLTFEERLDKKYLKKVFTGRTKKRIIVKIWDKNISLPWFGSFCKYEKIRSKEVRMGQDARRQILDVDNVILQEYQEEEHLYSMQEAESIFSEKINSILETLQEKGVQIIQKDVKIETYDDYWKVNADLMVIETLGTEAFSAYHSSEPLYLEETGSIK